MNKELLIQQIKDAYGADAAAAIEDSLDGFVLVPAEPTEERVRVLMRGWDSIGSHTMYENYRDMVALGEGK